MLAAWTRMHDLHETLITSHYSIASAESTVEKARSEGKQEVSIEDSPDGSHKITDCVCSNCVESL